MSSVAEALSSSFQWFGHEEVGALPGRARATPALLPSRLGLGSWPGAPETRKCCGKACGKDADMPVESRILPRRLGGAFHEEVGALSWVDHEEVGAPARRSRGAESPEMTVGIGVSGSLLEVSEKLYPRSTPEKS